MSDTPTYGFMPPNICTIAGREYISMQMLDGYEGPFAHWTEDRLAAQRRRALEAIHGPTLGPGRDEYYAIQAAAYRRADIRRQVADLVPGLHHGKFIRP